MFPDWVDVGGPGFRDSAMYAFDLGMLAEGSFFRGYIMTKTSAHKIRYRQTRFLTKRKNYEVYIRHLKMVCSEVA